MTMVKRVVSINGQEIISELQRKQVKHARALNLNVRPDLSIMVSAHDRVLDK